MYAKLCGYEMKFIPFSYTKIDSQTSIALWDQCVRVFQCLHIPTIDPIKLMMFRHRYSHISNTGCCYLRQQRCSGALKIAVASALPNESTRVKLDLPAKNWLFVGKNPTVCRQKYDGWLAKKFAESEHEPQSTTRRQKCCGWVAKKIDESEHEPQSTARQNFTPLGKMSKFAMENRFSNWKNGLPRFGSYRRAV